MGDQCEFSDEQLAEFRRCWEQANADAAEHMRREWERLIREVLPLRTRLRLWLDKQVISVGVWLADHGREGWAVTLWRVTGVWSALAATAGFYSRGRLAGHHHMGGIPVERAWTARIDRRPHVLLAGG